MKSKNLLFSVFSLTWGGNILTNLFGLLLSYNEAVAIWPIWDFVEPYQVVKIQLRSLKNNDDPFKNAGIEQTWEFAHPNNKKFTGPLEKFKILLSSDSYKMLLNHVDHNIIEVNTTDSIAAYEVTVLGEEKNYYKFKH